MRNVHGGTSSLPTHPRSCSPPHQLFFLYSASIAVALAAVPIVIRPLATTAVEARFSFGHRLCQVAIVVPLNNESAFLLIYCPVSFPSSSSSTAARLGSSRPLLLQQLSFLFPSTYRLVIKFTHAPTPTSQELQAVLQLFQITQSL
jgi:hypothetical protein